MRPVESGDTAPEDVPEEVIAQAKAVFAGRTSGEIAALVWDSLVDDGAPAANHRLRFQHPDLQGKDTGRGGSAAFHRANPDGCDSHRLVRGLNDWVRGRAFRPQESRSSVPERVD